MSAGTILTLTSGCGIDLLDPKASDIDFDSYAEQLAKEARFNGATPGQQYSVAEHLARGFDAILERTADEPLAAYWSLHDAPKACLKDDTTPKKRALAELCEQKFGVLAAHVIETFDGLTARHDAAIHEAARLPWPIPEEFVRKIKFWDATMFVTEWRDLMRNLPHPNWAPFSGIKPLVERIRPWRWEVAKLKLLSRWQQVLPSLQPGQGGDDIIRREVDDWDQRRRLIKQRYIDAGMPEEEADEKATGDVRREIRGQS